MFDTFDMNRVVLYNNKPKRRLKKKKIRKKKENYKQ